MIDYASLIKRYKSSLTYFSYFCEEWNLFWGVKYNNWLLVFNLVAPLNPWFFLASSRKLMKFSSIICYLLTCFLLKCSEILSFFLFFKFYLGLRLSGPFIKKLWWNLVRYWLILKFIAFFPLIYFLRACSLYNFGLIFN